MSIPPRYLDELRNRVTLSDVIGKRIKVTRAGREYKACCPFHREKTPSFTINDDKQFYHCFGCGAHGDVIGFVMQHDNLAFIDAIEMLSVEAGMTMPKPDPKAIEKAKEEKDLYALMQDAANWFESCLWDPANKDVYEYLKGRGLSDETMRAFKIGFAPADHEALRTYLKGQGYADKDMASLGLIKTSQKTGNPYVFFRERVMFPVSDRRGRVIAFGGRTLPDHLMPPRQDNFTPPKYLNSPDTPLFDKSRSLYGEALARQAAADGHSILVVEGYMDVIACYQAGFKGAVAPMGTALTEEQMQSMWKMIPDDEKSPVLCFDGDRAGQQAAVRSCERILPLLKPSHSARFAFLPTGEDPDSLIKSSGQQAFKTILQNAKPMIEFLWHTHVTGGRVDTPEARAGVIKKIKTEIDKINDKDVQIHYRQLINAKISDAFFPKRNNKKASYQLSVKPAHVRSSKNVIMMKALLAAVLNHPHIFNQVEEDFASLDMPDGGLARVHAETLNLLSENDTLDASGLQTHLSDHGLGKEIDDILNESVYVHAAFARKTYDSGEVVQKWMEFYNFLKDKTIDQEIRQGWRNAFEASNTEEEEKLKALMQQNASKRV